MFRRHLFGDEESAVVGMTVSGSSFNRSKLADKCPRIAVVVSRTNDEIPTSKPTARAINGIVCIDMPSRCNNGVTTMVAIHHTNSDVNPKITMEPPIVSRSDATLEHSFRGVA